MSDTEERGARRPKDYFGFCPEDSVFGDLAHDVQCAELLFEGLLSELAAAHISGRLVQWRAAGHAIVELLGSEGVPKRRPSRPVLVERDQHEPARYAAWRRLANPNLAECAAVWGWAAVLARPKPRATP